MTNKYDGVLKALYEIKDQIYASGFLSENSETCKFQKVSKNFTTCGCSLCQIILYVDAIEKFFLERNRPEK